ncbi:MAG: NifU family protein [Holophagaceae bacterium]|jgi:Fe-S cluster biogenesis protein NfuA
MPKISEIEYTPNPNAVKFLLKESVAKGFPKNFTSAEVAASDPLAKSLFEVGHVLSIYMQDKWITVTKDDQVNWTDLLPKLAAPIRSFQVTELSSETPSSRLTSDLYDPHDPILQRVQVVLNETILPALASDGGGLEVIGRHEKQILIRYQGACGTCPSSLTGTLAAIENLIHQKIDPELTVVSV